MCLNVSRHESGSPISSELSTFAIKANCTLPVNSKGKKKIPIYYLASIHKGHYVTSKKNIFKNKNNTRNKPWLIQSLETNSFSWNTKHYLLFWDTPAPVTHCKWQNFLLLYRCACVCVLCVVFSILWIRHQESGHINPAKSVSNTTLPRQIPLFKVTRPSYPKCLHKSTDKIASVISHRNLSIHNLSTL